MKFIKKHKYKLLSFVMVCISVFTLFLGINKTYAYTTNQTTYTIDLSNFNTTTIQGVNGFVYNANTDITLINNSTYNQDCYFLINYYLYDVNTNGFLIDTSQFNIRIYSYFNNDYIQTIDASRIRQLNDTNYTSGYYNFISKFNYYGANFTSNKFQINVNKGSYAYKYPLFITNIDVVPSYDVGLAQYYDTYYGAIEDNYNQLLEDYDTLESQYDSLQDDYNESISDYNYLEGQYNNLLDNYAELNGDYRDLQNNYNSLQQQYVTLQSTYSALVNTYNELSYNYSQLELAYQRLQRDYNNLQGNYNSLSNDFVDLNLQYDDLENSFNILQTQYNNMTSAMESLNKSIDDSLLSILVGNNYFTKSNIRFNNTNTTTNTYPIASGTLFNSTYFTYIDNSSFVDNVLYTNVALSKLLESKSFMLGENGVPYINNDKFSYIDLFPSILMPYALKHNVGSGSSTLHTLDYDYYEWDEPSKLMAKYVNLSIVSSIDLSISVDLINQDGSHTYLPISRNTETQNYEISFADDDSRFVFMISIECKYLNNSWVTAEQVISNVNYVNDNNYTIGYNNGYDSGITYMQNQVNDLSSQLVESNALNTDLQIRINALNEQINSFSADYGINNMLWTIASTPFESFKQIWNVELFGVNIAGAITGFLTSIIVLYIIKRFFL